MRQYAHLTLEERKVIQKMLWNHNKPSEIARELDRDRSSIIREIKRGISPDNLYRALEAHERSLKNLKGKKVRSWV